MEHVLSFDKLPEAVTKLTNEISELKRLFIEKQEQTTTQQTERLLTIQEASVFLSLAVPTIYSKVSKGELPFMKRSKRLYFSSSELIAYLKLGRKKSNAQLVADAENYLLNKKEGLFNHGK